MPPPLTITTGAALPLPGDLDLARLGFERIASGPAFLQQLAQQGDGRALLAAIFGNSPFLGQVLLSEPDILAAFLAQDSAAVLADLIAELTREAASAGESSLMMRLLRRFRRRAALLIALADISGRWTLEQVTGALADFADAALKLAVDHLLRRSAAAGDLALANPERP
ncbi:MAG TPA: glutamine-synthetase adenylyltransferase, partial [Candidatus Polarisedimenticolia bacterium]|nr:glutamine-synthetase adenylyltransferase [Candidatus Polarisedimenticolia bacterium]